MRIGTSGWSYPTGKGSWNGIFYPPGRSTRKKAGFDELRYYAEHFDTVEVNSTFYRPPRVATVEDWVRRTPSGFEFSLKLYQKFTHPRMFLKANPSAADIGTLPDVSSEDVDRLRAAFEPLARSQKLGALLAQFPPSFKSTPETQDYLRWLLRSFHDYQIAVELRHRTWSDALGETLELLNEYGAALVQIDEPKFRFSIRQNFLPNVRGFYYMRLHGRNAANWWRHSNTEDRYDYLYSKDELKPFAETASAVRQLVKRFYLYMNNHFAAKSVANAVMVKHELGLPVTGAYGPEMLERYPFLKEIVPAKQELRTLF
jgi:uncharacterized protein YecE (DUF72 family)